MRVKQTAREWSVTTVSPSINVSSRFSLSLQEEPRSADCRVQRRPPTLVLPLVPSRKLLPLGCRARYAIGSDLIFPGPEMLQTRDGWIRTRVLCDKGIISCTTLNESQLLICCKNSAVEMLWMWMMVFKLGQGAVH